MALLYFDGFESYPTADITKRWSGNSSFTGWSVGATGRNGNGMTVSNTSSRWLGRGIGSYTTTSLFGGCAFKIAAFPVSWALPIMGFGFASSNNWQTVILIDPVGNIQFGRTFGTNQPFLLTATKNYVVPGVWYYIELKSTLKSSTLAGDCKIWLEGTEIFSIASGVDLTTTYGTTADTFYLGSLPTANTNIGIIYDDVYVCDGTGSVNNTQLGDMRVESLLPGGAGTTTQWTPNASTNYSRVNETSQDGDTTYVATSTTGNIDSYAIGNLAITPSSVAGVQVCTVAKKTDGGVRNTGSVIRSGGTNYDHGSSKPFILTSGYTTNVDIWELDPNGSIAWTGTSVNALEAGVKLVS